MNVTREDLPGRQVALTIELDPETVNTALDRAYRQMVNQVNIPGFRRGKAPRYLVERYLGTDALTERAVRNILPDTLQEAIAEQELDALDISDYELVNTDPVTIKVVVVQKPVVELGDYSDIRVEREAVEITGEQVDQVIEELRRDGAPWNEPAEPRPIREGDMVYVDLEGFTSDGDMESVKREDFPTIVGVEYAGVPEVVNKALEGMSVGEEKDITETLPDDYPVENLRGKDAAYHVTVRSMKERQLPEVNEEWLKGLGFETVEALREAVERNLRQRAEDSAENNQVTKITDQLVDKAAVDIPDVMINEELDEMLHRLEDRLKGQRLTLRQYFTWNGTSEAEWRDQNREQARARVIRGLVLQEFARREAVSVEDQEVEGEIEQMLGNFEEQEKERARSILAKDESRTDLQNRLYNRKIVDRMVGIAEGRIEAQSAAAGASGAGDETAGTEVEATAETPVESVGGATASEEALEPAVTTANDIEGAAGAAELLNADEVRSPNETGSAEGGGTPSTAPGLDKQE